VGALVEALYGLSPIRRELQRLAGVENAVAAVTALSRLDKAGPVRVSDVANDLQLDLSVASRHLQALQERGFVERIADPEDGRSSLVAISGLGREKLEAAQRRLTDGLAAALADWEPAQISTLAEGLTRLQGTLGSPGHRSASTRPVGTVEETAR
jgi:DNA-binding MarR family transcriptional regulator